VISEITIRISFVHDGSAEVSVGPSGAATAPMNLPPPEGPQMDPISSPPTLEEALRQSQEAINIPPPPEVPESGAQVKIPPPPSD
jgi:hypothetical protein